MAAKTLTDIKRNDITVCATQQANALLDALIAAADKTENNHLEWTVRALVPRLRQINNVILSTADDDVETAESLEARLND